MSGIRLGIAEMACCAASTLTIAVMQGQAPPAPATPATQGGRGGIEQQTAAGADFLRRPPVARLSPEVQQKLFLLQPGDKIDPVLADPVIVDPGRRHL